MILEDLLKSDLISDTDELTLLLPNAAMSTVRRAVRGEWYTDRILNEAKREIVKAEFSRDEGWRVTLGEIRG